MAVGAGLIWRRPVVVVARIATLSVAGYIATASLVVLPRKVLGVAVLDARALAFTACALGLFYAFHPAHRRAREAWAILLTVSTFGRALSLFFVGDPEIDRKRELLGVYAWSIVWLAGVLAIVVLTGAEVLRRNGR